MSSRPAVSVVVPTYNRRERLHRVLTSLADQDVEEPIEVIVVSDGSTDGTDDYLASDQVPLPVVAVTQENQGPSGARNHGVERAAAPLVLFVDDDVCAAPHLVRIHLESHRRLGDHIVVVGPMLSPDDHAMSAWIAWEQEMLYKQYRAMEAGHYTATARQFYTGNASLRREHFQATGGFDTTLRRAEDIELAFRLEALGLTFHYEPAAIGYHYAERSYEAWLDTARAYGRNDVVFARDLGHDFIWGEIHNSYRRHHIALRALTQVCTAIPPLERAATAGLERFVRGRGPDGGGATLRYALSAQYCIEYHCGVAREIGSGGVFRALARSGTVPGQPNSA